MPPILALILCSIFIIYLLIMDFKIESPVSRGLWIPFAWMIIIGSRYISQWIDPGAILVSPEQYIAGSPIDRNIFLALIFFGLLILYKRKVDWAQLARNNRWIVLFFLYGGISILWSDYPFVSFKRYIKTIGHLVMVLIVLTDVHPIEALKAMIRRCSYVLMPLSIVLIKYFSEWGRSYNRWTGEAMYTGVTQNKNELGALCMICGLYFFWSSLNIWLEKNKNVDKRQVCIHILMMTLIAWLLVKANSATSLICLISGICILLAMGRPILKNNPKRIEAFIFAILFLLIFLQFSFEIYEVIISNFGRDVTLTTRTDLWKKLVEIDINPWIGTGYESFWLGERAEKFWRSYWWKPNQAHNGYLETYLNLGWLGLFFLLGLLVSAFKNIKKELILEFNIGKLRMAFFFIIILYNYTEAAFKGLHLMWFLLLLFSSKYPRQSIPEIAKIKGSPKMVENDQQHDSLFKYL